MAIGLVKAPSAKDGIRVRVPDELSVAISAVANAHSLPISCVVRALCKASLASYPIFIPHLKEEEKRYLEFRSTITHQMAAVKSSAAAKRREDIRSLRRSGSTIPAIARELGISSRDVIREIQRIQQEDIVS